MKKKRLGITLVLLLLLFSMPNISVTKSNENEIKNQPNDIYLPEKSKELENLFGEDVYKPSNRSQKVPYQEMPKIQKNNMENEQMGEKEKPSKLVRDGNTKAINPLATKENKARGTIIENIDKNGRDITPRAKDQTSRDEKKENPIDVRQFLTFQTKSGETMHLIVDRSENQENMQLLTEVGEQDLLNMIEGESEIKPGEEVIKKEGSVEEKPGKEEKEEKKSGIGLYLFIGSIIAGVMGAGYYFKIYEKNGETSFEDEQDYNELEDDCESEGEDYDLEDKEDTEIILDEDEF